VVFEKFTSAYFFQIAQEKITRLLINNIYMKKCEMVKQKKRRRIMQSGKTCTINCTILGSRHEKEKIWLVLTKPYCSLANHNPEFQCEICTVLHFLHSCYTFCTPFSANQNWVIFSCILFLVLKTQQKPLLCKAHTISQRSILLLGLRDCVSKWNTKTLCGLFTTVSTLKLWLSN